MDAKDFVDFSGYYIAMLATHDLIATAETATVETPAELKGINVESLRQHQDEGLSYLRRIASTMDDGIDVLLRDMAEKAGLRVKTAINAALVGNPVTSYRNRAKMLVQVFNRLSTHINVVHDALADAGQRGPAVVRAAALDTSLARLARVASIPAASGTNTRLKRWVLDASAICGNPVSEDEILANEIKEAQTLAKESYILEQRIEAKDPGDAEVPVLAEKKARINTVLKQSIEASSNPTITQTAVVLAKQEQDNYKAVTKVGQRITGGLTADKEECVMASGRQIIAAGAGSGKTRVLAAKVVYNIQEQNIPPSGIMAVSFSRKSAAELKARVGKFAEEAGLGKEDVNSQAYQGMGTTHSVARMILNRSGRYKISGDPKASENERPITGETQNKLLRVAIAQVQMKGGETLTPPPDAMTFFPNLGKKDFSMLDSLPDVQQSVSNPAPQASPIQYYLDDPARFEKMLDTALMSLNKMTNALTVKGFARNTKFGPKTLVSVSGSGIQMFGQQLGSYRINGQSGRFESANPTYRSPDQYIWWAPANTNVEDIRRDLFAWLGIDKVQNSIQALNSMGRDPKALTDDQKTVLESIITQPIVAGTLDQAKVRTSAELEKYEATRADKERDNKTDDFYFYLNNPANQWFNIGATEEDFMITTMKGDKQGEKKRITPASFRRYISLNKNNLKAPGDLYKVSTASVSDEPDEEELSSSLKPQIMAAVYGAYEWLKSNHPKTRSRLDYDDQLIQAVRTLTENPSLLRSLQTQYKCILVDEAQDLNSVQHLLFGLVAGYLNPSTLVPNKDGKMTAKTFAFIGDDKQAIYEFRGANPDAFIDKSDEFGGQFKTMYLEKNYRSGKAIVDAANKLIAYNSKQIPMVCTTDPNRGEGLIHRSRVGFSEEGPSVMVDRILSDLEEIKANDGVVPKDFYKRYGLATRTNHELQQYQFALIGAGIPFRSKRDPFEGSALRPIVSLFKMFLPGASVDVRNRGFILGLKTPDIGVAGTTVQDRLRTAGAGDFYDFCQKGGYDKVYKPGGYSKQYHDALKKYCTDYLPKLEDLMKDDTSLGLLEYIVNYKGVNDQTFIDQLAVAIRNNPEEMEEAQDLADSDDGDGEITDSILRMQAAKPLDPLYKLSEKYPKPTDFIGYLNMLATRSLQMNKTDDQAHADDNLVTLDTVHGWKGLECAHLFVPMCKGRFPIVRPTPSEEEFRRALESERRLAYVAITRGQDSVTIIEPTMRMKGNKIVPVEPSQFVTEACIQTKGQTTTKDTSSVSEKTASTKEAIRDRHLAMFLMPVPDEDFHRRSADPTRQIEAQWGDYLIEDPTSSQIEAQWGDYLIGD